MFFKTIFKVLNKARIKYVVTGGTAVTMYGYMRYTADLDIIVDLKESNLAKVYDVLVANGYVTKLPVTKEDFLDESQRQEWIKKRNMVAFSFYDKRHPINVIDIILDVPVDTQKIFKNRNKVAVDGVTVPLIAIKDLIKIKEKVGRPQDLQDVNQLKELLK